MTQRTQDVNLLLLVSKSLDKNETYFKKRLYYAILKELKYMDILHKEIINDSQLQDKIIKYIAKVFDLPEYYYYTVSRKHYYVTPRQMALTLIMDNTSIQLEDISEKFNRTHATVIHAHKTIDNLIETDKKFKKLFLYIKDELSLSYRKYKALERAYSKYLRFNKTKKTNYEFKTR